MPAKARAQQVTLMVDRDQAKRLGIDMNMVTAVLNNAYSQRQISTIYDSLNQYQVVMEVNPKYAQDPITLNQVQVITAAVRGAVVDHRPLRKQPGGRPRQPRRPVRLGKHRLRHGRRRDGGAGHGCHRAGDCQGSACRKT
jgi:hypothetical protein